MDFSLASYDDLPESVKPIADLIGLNQCLVLVTAFKGKKLYIPKHPTEYHKISLEIGIESFTLLSQEYGGNILKISPCKHLLAKLRNRQIKQRYESGERLSIIAVEYGLNLDYVYQILRGLKTSSCQDF